MAAIAHRLRCEFLEARRLSAFNVLELQDSLGLTIETSAMQGLRAAQIQLQFDPSVLSLDELDIKPGQAWQDQASVVSHIDAEQGTANIFVFSAVPIEGEGGNLVDLKFDVSHEEVSHEMAVDIARTSLTQLRLNEGAIASDVKLERLPNPEPSTMTEVKACSPWSADA